MNPKDRFASASPAASGIVDTIDRALAAAGLGTAKGPMQGVMGTIRRALGVAGEGGERAATRDATVIDVVAREVDGDRRETTGPRRAAQAAGGTFTTHRSTSATGSRTYKLYVPSMLGAAPVPLVVMLHGCTQSPDDFAKGTRMNRLADEHGFLVAYPEQGAGANASRCWNWFQAGDQVRDRGEPASIAGITREIASAHPVDPRRIFVAGLSAGAAMAVILGETYPELYAAVGAHSGLPYAAAHDMPSAFAAMNGRSQAGGSLRHFVPTIVFHGDTDRTVGRSNGAAIVRQATDASMRDGAAALATRTESGTAPGGRRYERTLHADADGVARIESWSLRGAGHAWSGGDASGSYTDADGPDASAEMLRFFLAQPAR